MQRCTMYTRKGFIFLRIMCEWVIKFLKPLFPLSSERSSSLCVVLLHREIESHFYRAVQTNLTGNWGYFAIFQPNARQAREMIHKVAVNFTKSFISRVKPLAITKSAKRDQISFESFGQTTTRGDSKVRTSGNLLWSFTKKSSSIKT